MKRVLFAHGKEGSPNGTKATMFKDNFDVTIPKLTNSYEMVDFLEDLDIIETIGREVAVMVGSSRGGALVAQARNNVRKILICPAWKKFKTFLLPYLTEDDIIIHSKADDLVPFEDSVLLRDTYGCTLIEAGYDHRMSDDQTLALIEETVRKVLEGEL
mgnify:FL=1